MPVIKRQVFDFVRKGRRYHRIARSFHIEKAQVEEIVTEGLREMESMGAKLPTFRSDRVNGFGKPMGTAVIAMPSRVSSGVAA